MCLLIILNLIAKKNPCSRDDKPNGATNLESNEWVGNGNKDYKSEDCTKDEECTLQRGEELLAHFGVFSGLLDSNAINTCI